MSVPASEATMTMPAAEAAPAVASEVSAPADMRRRSESSDPEDRRREKSAIEGVQRRNLLIIRLGRILCSVTFLPLRHLIPVIVALMAFIDA